MKKLCVLCTLLLLLFFQVREVHAVVAFLSPASSGTHGTSATTSWSYDVTIPAGGANTVAFLAFAMANGAGDSITSVTLDGQAMTSVTSVSSTTTSPCRVNLFRLINPPVGTKTATMTISTARFQASGTIVLQGVDQTTPTNNNASASNAGDTSSINMSVTTTTGEMIIDAGCRRNSSTTLTPTAGGDRTQRYTAVSTSPTAGNNVIIAGTTRTGSGALAMNWSATGSLGGIASVGTNVQDAPVSAGGLSLGFKLLR